MKKIFALVFLLVLGKISYSQYPISQNLGSDSTIVISKGALQSRLINVTFTDTIQASNQRIKFYPGAQIATTSGGINLWVRNASATAWIPIAVGSGNNIYTIDGTLTGNRTLSGGGNSLTFTGLSQFLLTVGNQTFTVTSDSASLTRKLSYATNRGSTFTLYSLVDKNYVDSAITSSPSGTVTSIATNDGSGITGGPITSTGTLAIDTSLISTRAWRQKGVDSLQANINLKLNILDTTGMLANYFNKIGYGLSRSGQTVLVDSASLSSYYLRRKDSLTTTNSLGYVTRKILADTAAAIRASDAGGSVTSVATNNGTGITGGTITTSGTLAIDTTLISTRAWRQKGIDSVANLPRVTSVGLTMPVAFNVAGSPVTSSGTFAVTGAGLASQYIRGDGTLANFPGGGGGGGSSVSYYLNGSINQGTFGGNTYYQMNKTPVIGTGTNFTIAANGYIAQFITNAGDPALLNIPAGNWNFEMYFSASSGGGNPQFYVELYKYDGTTFTLIASGAASPESITGGTVKDLYLSPLAVPATSLTLTDRLAVRVYILHDGRTITLHTEDQNLCQVITTFTTGITAINSLTAQVQYLTTGTSGTDFNISSLTDTHTFNLPVASATNTGKLSSANWTTFNNKIGPSDTASMLLPYLRKADTTSMLANYVNNVGYGLLKSGQVVRADSATLANYFLRRKDSLTSTNLLGYVTRKVLADTAAAIRSADAGGTVTSVATNNGTGITGGTITTAGTLAIDTVVISTRAWRQKGVDSLQANINLKLNISDTASMLSPYLRKIDTASLSNRINTKLNISDTSSMLTNYLNNVGYGLLRTGQVARADSATLASYFLRRKDSLTSSNLLGYVTRKVLADTAAAIRSADAGGTVTSVATNTGTGITGGTITTAGTLAIDTVVISTRAWRQKGIDSVATLANTKVGGSGTANYISKFTGTNTIANSVIFESGTSIGINTATPSRTLDVQANSSAIHNTSLVGTNASYVRTINTGGSLTIGIDNSAGSSLFGLNPYTAGLVYSGAYPLIIGTNGGAAISIPSTNRVGIGTASPDSLLTVEQGTLLKRGVRMSGLPTGVGTKALRIDANGTLSIADTTAGGSGTVTSVATNTGTGLTGGPITTSGTLAIDTITISTRRWRQKGIDSVQSNLTSGLALKVNISDTASMLLPYLRKVDTASLSNRINLKVNISDTASMLNPYLRKVDTASLSNRINLKLNISDTASMLSPYLRKIDTASLSNRINTKLNISDTATMLGNYVNNVGYGLLKSGQVVRADSATLASYFLRRKDSLTATNLLGYVTGKILADTAAAVRAAAGGGSIGGSGTTNRIAKFTASGTIGNSSIADSSSSVAMTISSGGNVGVNTTTIGSRLQVNGNAAIGYSASTAAPTNGLLVAGNMGIGTAAPTIITNYNALTINGTSGSFTEYLENGGRAFRIGSDGATGGFISQTTADPIRIFTNGFERIRITSGGNVGIGTTTPESYYSGADNLVVAQGSGEGGITIATANNTTGALYFADGTTGTEPFRGGIAYTHSTDVLTLVSGGAERMRITSGGSVGIGTTTIGSTLQVNGNAAIGYSASTAAPTNGLAVSGNVGIGTASPGQILHIASSSSPRIQVEATTNAQNAGIYLQAKNSVGTSQAGGMYYIPSTSTPYLGFYGDNTNLHLAITFDGLIGINTQTIGSRLQVNGNAAIGYSASTAAPTNGLAVSGNVGIGTTTPSGRLTMVVTNSGTNQLALEATNAANASFETYLRTDVTTINAGGTGNLVFANTGSVTERMRINSSGVAFIGNGETAGTPSLGIISGTGGTGTNIAGAEFRIRGGASTGSGAGGPITFYTSAAGSAGTSTNAATERMRITSGGLVGINTTSPDATLRVAGVANGLQAIFGFVDGRGLAISTNTTAGTNDAVSILNARGATSGTMVFQTDGNERMRITSGGDVGIGTSAPTFRLDVQGGSIVNGNGTIQTALTYATMGIVGTLSNHALALYTNNTEKVRITTGGNVGIGTTTPESYYSGADNLVVAQGSGEGGITIATANNTTGALYFADGTTGTEPYRGGIAYTHSTDVLTLVSGGAERMRITSGGNVGLGTTSPSGRLHIDPADNEIGLNVSTSSLTGANAQSLIDLAQTWNTTGNPTAIKLNITNTASGASAYLMDLQVGGTTQFRVAKDGAIRTTAPTGGTADNWKFGTKVASSVVFDDNDYLEVEVGGTLYRVALVNLAEPEPEAIPASTPEDRRINLPAKTSSQRIQELENEIQELKQMIKFLMPTSKNKK